MLSMVGVQPGAGDTALVTPGDAFSGGKPWFVMRARSARESARMKEGWRPLVQEFTF